MGFRSSLSVEFRYTGQCPPGGSGSAGERPERRGGWLYGWAEPIFPEEIRKGVLPVLFCPSGSPPCDKLKVPLCTCVRLKVDRSDTDLAEIHLKHLFRPRRPERNRIAVKGLPHTEDFPSIVYAPPIVHFADLVPRSVFDRRRLGGG